MNLPVAMFGGDIRQFDIMDCSILVVDDTEFNRTLITAMLQEDGFRRIDHAIDGVEALRKIAEEPPDLMILDIVMPGLDGFEVCQRLRSDERFADLPVLVQTALSDTEDRNRAFAVGTTDLIIKPIDRKELLARVRIHLENRVLIQKLQLYRARLESELFMAREMYNHLLPAPALMNAIGQNSAVQIRSHTALSSELGGTMWDLLPMDDERFGVYLLDVTGIGVSAALNAFRLHTVFNEVAAWAADPTRFLSEVNQRAVELFESGERAAIIYGVVDPIEDCFTYVTAAAERPILAGSDGAEVRLGVMDGLPVGVSADVRYRLHVLPFKPGDRLLLYSNAVLNGLVSTDRGAAETVLNDLAGSCLLSGSADDACLRVVAKLEGMSAKEPDDDMTLVLLARDP
jgi:sigma-B regulation protein RsbU (phosphoserine phosphatase)